MIETTAYLIEANEHEFADRETGEKISYVRCTLKVPHLGTIEGTGGGEVLDGLNGALAVVQAGGLAEVHAVIDMQTVKGQTSHYRFKVRSLSELTEPS